jgi:hypothetical protein
MPVVTGFHPVPVMGSCLTILNGHGKRSVPSDGSAWQLSEITKQGID